jgi:enoyl-CoA hydratase
MASRPITPPEDRVLAHKENGVGWLTFNQPERRNAMTLEMWEAVTVAVEDFSKDPDIRVVVMKGAGDKAFVSGGDISQYKDNRATAEAAAIYAARSGAGRESLASLDKPLIAMIRGFCLGGGLGLALTADFRVASTDSQFGIPAARLGIAYAFEGLRTLVSLVGPGMARKMMYTGDRYSAETALQMGIIEEVTTPDMLEATVRRIAEQIAVNAPISIHASKQTIAQVLKDESGRDMQLLADISRKAADSNDFTEGRVAFMEKRPAVFTGT